MITDVIGLKQLTHETLIPKHKSDLAVARAAIDAGYPAVGPVLPELTQWVQDLNWPVAKILAPFLASIGSPMIPHIDFVLASNDPCWKYWIISCVIGENASLLAHYHEELSRIANKPTKNERHHELDYVSREAVKNFQSD